MLQTEFFFFVKNRFMLLRNGTFILDIYISPFPSLLQNIIKFLYLLFIYEKRNNLIRCRSIISCAAVCVSTRMYWSWQTFAKVIMAFCIVFSCCWLLFAAALPDRLNAGVFPFEAPATAKIHYLARIGVKRQRWMRTSLMVEDCSI